MVNMRQQVLDLLKTINANVKMGTPEGDIILPLITYGEITNITMNSIRDSVNYQVDAYAGSFEECVSIMESIDEKMIGLGFYRTYITPDNNSRQDKDLYHKAANYKAEIDTHLKNIIQKR